MIYYNTFLHQSGRNLAEMRKFLTIVNPVKKTSAFFRYFSRTNSVLPGNKMHQKNKNNAGFLIK